MNVLPDTYIMFQIQRSLHSGNHNYLDNRNLIG